MKKTFAKIIALSLCFISFSFDVNAHNSCDFYGKIEYYINSPNTISLKTTGETVKKIELVVNMPKNYTCNDTQHNHNNSSIKNKEWSILSTDNSTEKSGVYIDSDGTLHAVNNAIEKSEYFNIICKFSIDDMVISTQKTIYIEKTQKQDIPESKPNTEFDLWENILHKIERTKDRYIKEDIVGDTDMPSKVHNALYRTNKKLELYVGNNFYYIIDGTNLRKTPNNIAYIPLALFEYKDKYINSFFDNNSISIFDIENNKNFSGTYHLRKDLPTFEYVDKTLHLYKFYKDKIYFLQSKKADNKGDVVFDIYDGGTYIITPYKIDDNHTSLSSSNSSSHTSSSSIFSSTPSSASSENSSDTQVTSDVNTTSFSSKENSITSEENHSVASSSNSEPNSNHHKFSLLAIMFTIIIILSIIIILLLLALYHKK